MVRGRGYIKSIKDIEMIAVGGDRGTPILVRDIGQVALGPDMRRGVAELNGEGEIVSGVVVMRYGENALNLIERVKQKIKEIEPSLPPGVKIVTAYDRSDLILKSIATLKEKLIEEGLIVSAVIIIFLFHGWHGAGRDGRRVDQECRSVRGPRKNRHVGGRQDRNPD